MYIILSTCFVVKSWKKTSLILSYWDLDKSCRKYILKKIKVYIKVSKTVASSINLGTRLYLRRISWKQRSYWKLHATLREHPHTTSDFLWGGGSSQIWFFILTYVVEVIQDFLIQLDVKPTKVLTINNNLSQKFFWKNVSPSWNKNSKFQKWVMKIRREHEQNSKISSRDWQAWSS